MNHRGFSLNEESRYAKNPLLTTQLQTILEDANSLLSGRLRLLIIELKHEWDELDKRIEISNAELQRIAKQDDACHRLMEIPGFGSLAQMSICNKCDRLQRSPLRVSRCGWTGEKRDALLWFFGVAGARMPSVMTGETDDRHPAQLIMAMRTDLHPKTESIYADFSSRPNFPLQSCGGPHILRSNPPW